MFRIGLTGNVASGKSSVARVWRELGATVIDADELARRAVAPGTEGLARIVEEWGSAMLAPDGTLDRARLRETVFRDAAARARLESIVHPAVGRLRDAEYEVARARGESLVVADIPLLFEVGLQDEFDVVVLVDAPEEVRLQRLVRDRGLEHEAARRIVDAQIPPTLKRGRADLVIDNDGTLDELRARAVAAWQRLVERASAARRNA